MTSEWDSRINAFWDTVEEIPADTVLPAMHRIVAERPAEDPAAVYEWASVHDYLGREAEAIPLYEAALAHGLAGERRPQALIQLASSLRNVGRADEAIRILQDLDADPVTGDAAQAFLALSQWSTGQPAAALSTALTALSRTLPLYRRSVEQYAQELGTDATVSPASAGHSSDRAGSGPLVLRPVHGPNEYPALVAIWGSAVRATHDFLAEEDFHRIEAQLAPAYFPAVTLTVAERDGVPVGFAGTVAGGLEMLFVSDAVRGGGVGSALLADAIARHDVTRVDVNEQNPGAAGFYRSRGFVQTGRSELDGDGRPYPILHLTLPE
ncbi:Histone acetyltransferase HPA2 and related acetyltransferases [Leucobacter sp. 7(1)]|uniref:tetratricopeptide repeat protein n=1 Tax=Leucobacter sp. 7(1) TaxID=1255613 RepID=UPI00097EF890|nr:Histone acetyltransferase HPA2 and related acetyltransferases [Leucobacter sp. 7(1)]